MRRYILNRSFEPGKGESRGRLGVIGALPDYGSFCYRGGHEIPRDISDDSTKATEFKSRLTFRILLVGVSNELGISVQLKNGCSKTLVSIWL